MTRDPILAEVVRHGLQAVAEEMGAALIRTAHSVNIRDRRDFSCGVFSPDGSLAAQAEHIPMHLGVLAGVVERVLATEGARIEPGTMVMTNDPWLSGSHLPDVVVIAPVDADGQRLGYVANMAHQVDLGGLAPGSCALGAEEIFQEGLRVSPLVLVRGGEVDGAIVELFRINSRTPDMIGGDILAQVAANTTGVRRLVEFVSRVGKQRFDEAVAVLNDATARRLAHCLSALPRRTARFEDVLEWQEGDQDEDLVIKVAIEAKGDRLSVDFSGTAAQVRGPINAPRPVTISCVLYVVKALLDPDAASNAGLLRQIDIVTEPGTLVDATFPAAVSLCTSITSQRVCDVLFGAFNTLFPDAEVAASTGSMNGLLVGGIDPRTGTGYSYVETYGGGQGALAGLDGGDGVHTHMTNTANTPVELIERSYPLTVLRYGLVPESGGQGRYRGGHGITRELRLESDATITVQLDRSRNRPWGVHGGLPARGSQAIVRSKDGERQLPPKCTVKLPAGSVISIQTAGGGGWGPPEERDPADRRRDAVDELMPYQVP